MDKGEQETHAASTAPPVLVAQIQEATGLSEAAVRSVLWQTRQLGYRIVKLGTYSGVEPPYITEEWTP